MTSTEAVSAAVEMKPECIAMALLFFESLPKGCETLADVAEFYSEAVAPLDLGIILAAAYRAQSEALAAAQAEASALRAKVEAVCASMTGEATLKTWDNIRRQVETMRGHSLPRDAFEALVEGWAEDLRAALAQEAPK